MRLSLALSRLGHCDAGLKRLSPTIANTASFHLPSGHRILIIHGPLVQDAMEGVRMTLMEINLSDLPRRTLSTARAV
jgi:hypothetical protein